jgi:hypothetical protein
VCVAGGYQYYRQGRCNADDHQRHSAHISCVPASKYEAIQVNDVCATGVEKAWNRSLPSGWRGFLDTLIAAEELQAAVSKEIVTKFRVTFLSSTCVSTRLV